MTSAYKNQKVLILGSQGNLGTQILEELTIRSYANVIAWTRKDCDLCDFSTLEEKITQISPSIVINTVAYNNVDACEKELSEQRKAITLNINLVDCLSRICKKIDCKFMHFSSNYVFSGHSESYVEKDTTTPVNFYGLTKQIGEDLMLTQIDSGLDGILIRVSNLFGPLGSGASSKPSFFDIILNATKKEKTLDIVDDEKCCFTYTKDVAVYVLDLIEHPKNIQGIYHIVNRGATTWYEAASMFFEKININVDLNPILGELLKRPAIRPKSAILIDTKKIKDMRLFEDALDDYISTMRVKNSK